MKELEVSGSTWKMQSDELSYVDGAGRVGGARNNSSARPLFLLQRSDCDSDVSYVLLYENHLMAKKFSGRGMSRFDLSSDQGAVVGTLTWA